MWGFARPAVIWPWLSAAFPLCFFCLIHLFIFPVWQAITWQAFPRSGQQEENTAASSTFPARLRKTHSQDWRFGERACATGVCAALSPTHVSSAPPVNSLALSRTRKSTTKSNFLPSTSQINNRPAAHEDIKMCIPCILHALPVYYGWWSTIKNVAKTEVCRQHQYTLLWSVGCCSGAVNTVYCSGVCFTWLLRQHEVLHPSFGTWGSSSSMNPPRSACYLVIPTGPGPHLGQSAKLSWLWWTTALGEYNNRLVCQCLWVTRATGFWSSDGKWSFHHLSGQFVLQCMFYLGQDTVLVVQVLMPKFGGQMPLPPQENKCIFLEFTVRQQRSSCSLTIQTPPLQHPDQLNETEGSQEMLWDVHICNIMIVQLETKAVVTTSRKAGAVL